MDRIFEPHEAGGNPAATAEDPTSGPGTAPRESIEVRALVFRPAENGA